MFGTGTLGEAVAALEAADVESCGVEEVESLLATTSLVTNFVGSFRARLFTRADLLAAQAHDERARRRAEQAAADGDAADGERGESPDEPAGGSAGAGESAFPGDGSAGEGSGGSGSGGGFVPDGEALAGRDQTRSAREIERERRRAEVIAAAPVFGGLLAAGRIGPEHVDAIADAAGRLDQRPRVAELFAQADSLAARAVNMVPEAFRKYVNKVARGILDDEGVPRLEAQKQASKLAMWVDTRSGMCCGRFELDPERGSAAFHAIEALVASIAKNEGLAFGAHTNAEALHRLLTANNSRGGANSGRGGGGELTLVIDADTLTGGLHDQSVCETTRGTPLPPETVRRLTCSAPIVALVRDSTGMPLHVGRADRTANRAQRRALAAMYRGCAIDGCDTPFDWCQIHHIIPWHVGGPTNLDNLIPLCGKHHHACHEGKWHLTLDTNRTMTVTKPDGTKTTTALPHPPHGANPPPDPEPDRPTSDPNADQQRDRDGPNSQTTLAA